MRLFRLGLSLVLALRASNAFAQVPRVPAPEPAPDEAAATSPAPAASPAAVEGNPNEPPAVAPPSAPPTPSVSAPANPQAEANDERPTQPTGAPGAVPAASESLQRARAPLTLEGRLGLLLRPDSGSSFDDETHSGVELGLSLYVDLKRELALGLELERAGLGRGTALSGLDSVSIDYSASSIMLGLRAYPKRSELLDLFVGVQLGAGVQGVSASGTASRGFSAPARAYRCAVSDVPGLQLGGGVGARLMLSPRWGLTARINGTGRRLSGELVDDCAQGIGSAITVSGSLGLGYDFELEP